MSTYRIYAAVLRGTGTCTAAPLAGCNTYTYPQFPGSSVVLEPAHTGVSGALTLGALANPERVVDADPNNFATISTTLSLLGTVAISVKDVKQDYSAGTFAGFEISKSTVLDVDLLNNISIQTFLNGVPVETSPAASLVVGTPLLSSSGRFKVGFVTSASFDEVQLLVTQPVGVSLGVIQVYSVVLKQFCAGPPLACNTPTTVDESTYPVYVNMARTGFAGTACVGCEITGLGNLLDGDQATVTAVTVVAGALGTAGVSVKDQITDYPAGSFAGYQISNPELLDVSVLDNFTLTTYLNGVQQESRSGSGLVAGVSTALLGGVNLTTIGFSSTLPFDEIQFRQNNTINVNIGTTLIYGAVFENFCSTPFVCGASYWLNNPAQAVIVNNFRTGLGGIACVGCAVTNPQNVISADTTDYAELITLVGALGGPSISVQDVRNVYPEGTIAGFGIRDMNELINVELLNSLTLRTYLNGTLQETRSGAGSILDLTAVLPLIRISGSSSGYHNVGFVATQPFDEVRLTAGSLATVINDIHVYGAFVDTRYATNPGGGGSTCVRAPLADPDHSGTPMNIALEGNLSINDRDPQGSPLTYNTTPVVGPQHGVLTLNSDGVFTYTPSTGYVGRDSFRYEVCNGLGLCTSTWAYISVLGPAVTGGPNRPPRPQTDWSQTIVNTPVTGDAASNDADPDNDLLTYSLVKTPQHGTLTLAADGTYTYTPAAGFVGRDTATLEVCDDASPSLCDVSIIVLEVFPDMTPGQNHPPFAQNDVYVIPNDEVSTGNVLRNDSDPENDLLTASLISIPGPGQGTITMDGSGNFIFTPEAGYEGTVMLLYQTCDATLCDTATLVIVVQRRENPLPLELLSFKGSVQGCQAMLNWEYAADNNLAYFEVEASIDGITYQKLARIEGRNSGHAETYRYEGRQSARQTLYRIRVVDKDGSAAFSKSLRLLTTCDDANPVVAYPNPTKGQVYLEGLQAGETIAVYDLAGRLVMQMSATATRTQVDLSTLSPGYYQLVVDGATPYRTGIAVER